MTLEPRPDDSGTPDSSLSPLGDQLWRPTSMIRLRSPLTEARGVLRAEGVTHSMRGHHCVVRPYKEPSDPKTPVQIRRRDAMGLISAHWHTLPADVRAAWQAFAEEYLRDQMPGCKPGNLGQDAWVAAQFRRLGAGLGWGEAAPAAMLPAARITAIEELPPLLPGSLRLQVWHDMPYPAGHFLLIQMTRPLASPKRKAKDNAFRWAAAVDQDSFPPLGGSGAVYTIASPVLEVPSGAPYGVRVRVVNGDGLAGEARTRYGIRR